ncbi:MAG: hypothetical protein AAF204_01390 [Pseudomonadota bacterium]
MNSNIKVFESAQGKEIVCIGVTGERITIAANFGESAHVGATKIVQGPSNGTSRIEQAIASDGCYPDELVPRARIPSKTLSASPDELASVMVEHGFSEPAIS